MILDKWKERRHVENIRSFLKGLALGFFMMIVIGLSTNKNISSILNLATIVILIMANIYFTATYRLAEKYYKYISKTHTEIEPKLNNKDDIFVSSKLDEFRRLGVSVLNDTIININEFYNTVVFVYMITSICTCYNLYRLYSHVIQLWHCILLILIIAVFFINIVGLIGLFKKINGQTKNFIIKEGWDKKWGK